MTIVTLVDFLSSYTTVLCPSLYVKLVNPLHSISSIVQGPAGESMSSTRIDRQPLIEFGFGIFLVVSSPAYRLTTLSSMGVEAVGDDAEIGCVKRNPLLYLLA